MRRALIASVVVAAGLLVAGAGPAQGCSCGRLPLTPELLAGAEAAFVGTVTDRVANEETAVTTFAVERVYGGRVGPVIHVVSGPYGAACGLEAEPGDRVGLFASATGGRWESSLCATRPAADFEAASGGYEPDPAVGPGRRPVLAGVAPAGGREGGPGGGLAVNVAVGGALALAAVAAVAAIERRAS